MFHVVSTTLCNGEWVEKVVGVAATLLEGKEKADKLNESLGDEDSEELVSYILKPVK